MPEATQLFVWTEALAVGHPLIDAEHRQLFGLAERLHESMLAGNGKAMVHSLLAELSEYTHHHFDHEEQLMRECRFPGLDAHLAQHDELRHHVYELERRVESGAHLITIEFMQFLDGWLKHHTGTCDRAIAEYAMRKQTR